MQKSSIAPEILQQMFDSALNAGDKGQSQFFTPLAFGQQLAIALPKWRGTIVDLQCGEGHLLQACANPTTKNLLGSDIDSCQGSTPHPIPLPDRGGEGVQSALDVECSMLNVECSPKLPKRHLKDRIIYDTTLLYPLLKEVRFKADLFALNPPWGMQWHRDRLTDLENSEVPAVRQAFQAFETASGEVIDSTIATLLIALDLCSAYGEGLLIANNATLQRLIFNEGAPYAAVARHIWAHVIVPGNPMTGDDKSKWSGDQFYTGVIYFARGHTTGPKKLDVRCSMFDVGCSVPIDRAWHGGRDAYEHLCSRDTIDQWRTVRDHVRELSAADIKPRWNLWLDGFGKNKTIQTYLSRFEAQSVKTDKNEAKRLHDLQGKSPMQLVLQRNERAELVHVARDAGWRVQPELLAAIDSAIAQYHAAWAPLYPLSEIMRLGYLDEHDFITCREDLYLDTSLSRCKRASELPSALDVECSEAGHSPALRPIFQKGQTYPIRTHTVDISRTAWKPNSMTGELEEVQYSGKELAIYLKGFAEVEYAFLDARLLGNPSTGSGPATVKLDKRGSSSHQPSTPRHQPSSAIDFTLQQLADHFTIPEVPDVATVNPAGFARNLAALELLENQCGIKLKLFQKQDLARAALHQGLIMGWDTGLGKTWTLFIFALLKCGYSVVEGELMVDSGPGPLERKLVRLEQREGRSKVSSPPLDVGCSMLDVRCSRIAVNAPALIVAPEDLHEQIRNEARDCFKTEVTRLDSKETFDQLCQKSGSALPALTTDGRPIIPPGFYITSYTQLALNGVQKLPDAAKFAPKVLLELLGLKIGIGCSMFDVGCSMLPQCNSVAEFFEYRCLSETWKNDYETFSLDHRHATLRDLERAVARETTDLDRWADDIARHNRRQALEESAATLRNLVPQTERGSVTRSHQLSDLSETQQDFVIQEFCRLKLAEFSRGIGEIRHYKIAAPKSPLDVGCSMLDVGCSVPEAGHGPALREWKIKCVYSPSLSDLCYNAFDAVSIDEGVRLKGEETAIGLAVRQLDPLYRNLATATPIKNRLTDIFWLAWWAAGGKAEAHARFPFSNDPESATDFANTFLIQSQVEGKRRKATAEVCNIHRLWKLFGPIVLRRRKADCGEDIVPRVKHIIRCKMGTQQARVYKYHMEATYLDRRGKPAIGAKLQALRQAAVCPATDKLEAQAGSRFDVGCSMLDVRCSIPRSSTNYIPKTAAVLTLVREIMERGEQVCIFAAFNDPNDYLCQLLEEAGVRTLLLDGRTNPRKRGAAAAVFKAGRKYYQDLAGRWHQPIPVAVAGVDSMAEGHSFHRCRNVILYCYSWAFDKFKQALDRVHRLNSELPVNVYVIFCDGTIDQRLESLTDEKSDSAELVLDGHLIGERAEEVNFAELLAIAQSEFNAENQTIDEATLQAEWPVLREQLRAAQQGWDEGILMNIEHPMGESAGARVRDPQPEPETNIIPLPTPIPAGHGPALHWRQKFLARAARMAQLTA